MVNFFPRCPTRRWIQLFAAVLVSYIIWLILWEVHIRTYVWQSTMFIGFVNSRTSCDIAPSTPGKVIAAGSLKIAILVMYGQSTSGDWGDDLMGMMMKNRYDYAKRNGYEVINANAIIDSSRPVAWSKLLAVRKYLPQYDYIFYIDTDAVFMNPSIRLEDLIVAGDSGYAHTPKDFIMSKDWNGPNTGAFFAHRSNWTLDFLQLAWNQEQLVPPVSPTSGHGKHPFEYEQRAFHYLLNTRVWKSRPGLPTYSPYKEDAPPGIRHSKSGGKSSLTSKGTTIGAVRDSNRKDNMYSLSSTLRGSGSVVGPADGRGLGEEKQELSSQLSLKERVGSSVAMWSHFSFTLPQCAMNSYSLHPLDFQHTKYTSRSQFVDGDFIIHFAGKKGEIKMAMLKYYLMLAQHNFKKA